MANYTIVTPELKARFLEELEKNGGIISKACDVIGVARKTMYDHRASDAEFNAKWIEALDKGFDVLEDEAKRRAFGFKVPVFFEGQEIGEKQEHSDYLMAIMLKGHRVRYKDRVEVSGNVTSTIIFQSQAFPALNKRLQAQSVEVPTNGNGHKD